MSGLTVNINHVSGSVGTLSADFGCEGATLGPSSQGSDGGSCTVQLTFSAGCPLAGNSSWNLIVAGNGGSVSVPVTGYTASGACN